jgi:peroxin-5
MADCGAAGTTLDRVASSLMANTNNQEHMVRAGKAISSFMGGMAVGHSSSTTTTLMPATPLETLILPTTSQTYQPPPSILQQSQQQQQPQQPIMVHPQQQHPQQQSMMMQPSTQMMHPMQIQMMQQQQQMQYQMQMSQQMQWMSQQQHQQRIQHQQRMQQQQQLEKQQQEEEVAIQEEEEEEEEETEEEWHDNLEHEFQSYLESRKEASVDNNDGVVDDVTIEQLAKAWEEANLHIHDDIVDEQFSYHQSSEQQQQQLQSKVDPSDYIRPYEFSQESQTYHQSTTTATTTQQQQQHESEQDKNSDVLLKEGIQQFHEGNTKDAIVKLESYLQTVDMDSSEAWLYLGKSHAENDQDVHAIACLQRAVERDPYCTEALLALGVSYVNELDYDNALQHLTDWVTHHPDYAGLDLTQHTSNTTTTTMTPLDQLKQLLTQAIDYTSTQSSSSLQNNNNSGLAHVLEAFGVLCNVSHEYDQAIDAFRRALDIQPKDYQLWNKLGATLANSNRSKDALPAYHRAIALKPKYARAWLNMAISHSNLQNHHESVRCYLQTLALNKDATHVWSYMRISLTCDEKWDLFPLVAARDINGFQDHYDFVTYNNNN